MADPEEGVLVVTETGGLLWHPWPLPPLGPEGTPLDPPTWVGMIAPGGRWARARRPSPGWTPPDPTWGESARSAGSP